MRNSLYSFAFLLVTLAFASEEKSSEPKSGEETVNTSKPVTYVAGIVKMGENWQQDSLRAFELQEKHLKFLEQLRSDNKLIASGPLTSDSDARGLYIFNVTSIEEAEALISSDEAIQSGWIKMELHIWQARDYKVGQPTVTGYPTSGGFIMGWQSWSLLLFTVILVIFTLRTFRGKADV